ncbi:hypothetical protein PF005_g3239 [Phytophthora fragariae]|uniref:Uncharacterized protein n=1 Tax=Phytophthora fragariae TaxID=53985 RepID=A0A6A4EPV1_9STRA|nr:hypothetical protein PF009_g3457 [Phytophthora fragariae]KAE9133516.1 hypothetical protein PF010_g2783 [Phytophthora fragariae]KAE9133744.1 hypothetical protein PF007_g3208 [Phytophthora fragariae]KAE9153229.1 hypothetical protein PF006_g2621 [Phytophthora fragariae]KAE9231032.1 hypothetical protein PF005_g3239 [Phytophthora fragariae]
MIVIAMIMSGRCAAAVIWPCPWAPGCQWLLDTNIATCEVESVMAVTFVSVATRVVLASN